MKPAGAAHIPQPIPRCDACGFVFIEDYFTDEEIRILRSHILEEDVFSGKENFPKYYYLALELELLGNERHDHMIYFSVCSVWEYSFHRMAAEYMEENGMENTNGIKFDAAVFQFLMQDAVEKINGMSGASESYNNMQLVKLDFLRRLGLFKKAKIVIEKIRNNKALYQGIIVDIIEYQTALLKNKDIDEHYLAEIIKE